MSAPSFLNIQQLSVHGVVILWGCGHEICLCLDSHTVCGTWFSANHSHVPCSQSGQALFLNCANFQSALHWETSGEFTVAMMGSIQTEQGLAQVGFHAFRGWVPRCGMLHHVRMQNNLAFGMNTLTVLHGACIYELLGF